MANSTKLMLDDVGSSGGVPGEFMRSWTKLLPTPSLFIEMGGGGVPAPKGESIRWMHR
jgi:hypothetical protein